MVAKLASPVRIHTVFTTVLNPWTLDQGARRLGCANWNNPNVKLLTNAWPALYNYMYMIMLLDEFMLVASHQQLIAVHALQASKAASA
eukprot:1144540-Pelagomonas_calceolata.AAC.3